MRLYERWHLSCDLQVGLVVGRQGVGNRDFVLWLAPTPENPDGPVLAQHNVSKVSIDCAMICLSKVQNSQRCLRVAVQP